MKIRGTSLLLVALAAAGCSSGSGSPKATSSTDAPEVGHPHVAVPTDLATACPDWTAPVRYAEGDLPPGAESVRLCPGQPIVAKDGTLLDVGIQPPEVLTARVDTLVEAVNSLEAAQAGEFCSDDGGPRLTYWFTYPDGDARAVTFESFGCEHLIVGEDSRRAEGTQVARRFAATLFAQRAEREPPTDPVDVPDCRGVFADPITALPIEPLDLEVATLCVSVGPYRVRPAVVPSELLPTVERDLLAEEMDWDECVEPPRRYADLLGYTRWGDRVRYSLDACGHVLVPRVPGWIRAEETAYRLPPALAAELDALELGPVIRYTYPILKLEPSGDGT